MKKLLLFFFIPFISFSQNDFREMNWGESSKILKEKYSETSFQRDVLDEDITVFSHKKLLAVLIQELCIILQVISFTEECTCLNIIHTQDKTQTI